MKKVLILGAGGREHALAWKLKQEAEVLWAPGNAGALSHDIETASLDLSDPSDVVRLVRHFAPDLVVVGPEDPLIAGLADTLRLEGTTVLGPGASGARLEGSKAFSKDQMVRAGIPTATFETFTESGPAKDFARKRFGEGRAVVVKASGAALGKGVIVCGSLREAEEAIEMMLDDAEFGEAGKTIVVEDRLAGFEFSLLTLVNENGIQSLPVAQDYKRALDGDRGPNTGGMGTYSPVPSVSYDLIRRTEAAVVKPLIESLKAQGIDYRGILFSGLMVENDEPTCLEYNVRFGDPETQSVMRRIGTGFLDALLATAKGEPIPAFNIENHAAVTVVMASQGYPGSYEKGHPIDIPELSPGVVVFHAGTKMQDATLVSNGGRVLGVSATGATQQEARESAYKAVASIHAPGLFARNDIAKI